MKEPNSVYGALANILILCSFPHKNPLYSVKIEKNQMKKTKQKLEKCH